MWQMSTEKFSKILNKKTNIGFYWYINAAYKEIIYCLHKMSKEKSTVSMKRSNLAWFLIKLGILKSALILK